MLPCVCVVCVVPCHGVSCHLGAISLHVIIVNLSPRSGLVFDLVMHNVAQLNHNVCLAIICCLVSLSSDIVSIISFVLTLPCFI